jgi:hypothetical protein
MIEHVTYIPRLNKPPEEVTYAYDNITVMSNEHMLWQIRECTEPGVVNVIAAFKEKEDAIAFMTLISNNKGHGVRPKKAILGCCLTREGFEQSTIYSIEHNCNKTKARL